MKNFHANRRYGDGIERATMRVGFLSLLALTLAGCEIVNHDQTAEPVMASLVNHSFIINKDSFLLENYCLDGYTTRSCLYMQAVGGTIQVGSWFGNAFPHLPTSFQDYEQNKDTYNASFRDEGIFRHTSYAIVAEIPKGTHIKITRIVSIAEGDQGRGWAVFGIIERFGIDVSIQIGSGHLNQNRPRWFWPRDSEHYNLPPQPLPDFLSPSDGSS